MKIKTVTILGSGAVGLFYGAQLKRGGAEVRFLVRSDFEQVRKNGLTVHSIAGDFHEALQVFSDPQDCSDSDLVLICLKTTAKDYLMETLPKLCRSNPYVMGLQNGLGNEELLATLVPEEKIIGGVAFVCLNREAPGVVFHSAFGTIKVQGFSSAFNSSVLNEIQQYFKKAGIELILTDSLLSIKWEKLIWNVPFNGLSATLGGVDTASILRHKPSLTLVRHLMEEVIKAASSQNVVLNEKLIKENIDKTLKMGPYLTSMCLDRRKGYPLEAETIVGEPLRRGKAKGLDLPYMESLYAALSFYNESLNKTSRN